MLAKASIIAIMIASCSWVLFRTYQRRQILEIWVIYLRGFTKVSRKMAARERRPGGQMGEEARREVYAIALDRACETNMLI
jgi:hypothetical protein